MGYLATIFEDEVGQLYCTVPNTATMIAFHLDISSKAQSGGWIFGLRLSATLETRVFMFTLKSSDKSF